jgi:DNA (cytosine-5)-methyltransferase 1
MRNPKKTVAESRVSRADLLFARVQPLLTKYYGTASSAQSVDDPLDTVTAKARFALVEPKAEGQRIDIRFRMLQPHELAAAMGFDNYNFTGNKTEQVKQIGNAVPVREAKAICKEILSRN